jgi:predicted nucleotidyltransferase
MDILNLKSQLRRKLLLLFFSNPEKKYYIRQLERLISFPASNISTELKRLNKSNLFNIEKVGGIVFHQINRNHPIYNELKSIIFKTIGIEGGIRNALNSISGIEYAFIFGSYASGKEREMSDIDLFVIGNPDMDLLSDVLSRFEDLVQRSINYHLYSLEDWIRQQRENNSFIENIKNKPKIFVTGDEQCLKINP